MFNEILEKIRKEMENAHLKIDVMNKESIDETYSKLKKMYENIEQVKKVEEKLKNDIPDIFEKKFQGVLFENKNIEEKKEDQYCVVGIRHDDYTKKRKVVYKFVQHLVEKSFEFEFNNKKFDIKVMNIPYVIFYEYFIFFTKNSKKDYPNNGFTRILYRYWKPIKVFYNNSTFFIKTQRPVLNLTKEYYDFFNAEKNDASIIKTTKYDKVFSINSEKKAKYFFEERATNTKPEACQYKIDGKIYEFEVTTWKDFVEHIIDINKRMVNQYKLLNIIGTYNGLNLSRSGDICFLINRMSNYYKRNDIDFNLTIYLKQLPKRRRI